jgi:hypothetical protein
MRTCSVELGDEVVHQSHPGRFTVVDIERRPSMNVYSDILTIRSRDGVEMRVLDTVVRKLEQPPTEAAKDSDSED